MRDRAAEIDEVTLLRTNIKMADESMGVARERSEDLVRVQRSRGTRQVDGRGRPLRRRAPEDSAREYESHDRRGL